MIKIVNQLAYLAVKIVYLLLLMPCREIVGTAVLVVKIVGMFPYIKGQQWRETIG